MPRKRLATLPEISGEELNRALRALADRSVIYSRPWQVAGLLGLSYCETAGILDRLEALGLIEGSIHPELGPVVRLLPKAELRLRWRGLVAKLESEWKNAVRQVGIEKVAELALGGRSEALAVWSLSHCI